MTSLYWRIFLSFWLALALILVGTVSVVVNGEQQKRFAQAWVQRTALYAQATQAFESGGEPALKSWLQSVHPAGTLALTYIVDSTGREMLGRSVPDYLRLSPDKIAENRQDAVLHPAMRPVTTPLVLVGPDGRTFHVIIGPLRSGPHLFGELEMPSVSSATLLIALVVSAVVCFFLARYLVSPVDQLRRATRQIASGDLAVHVSSKLKGRTDELGLLAADLDTMSQRVRNLLESKQQLLRDVSHELRSPLARLQLALSLARRQEAGSVERHLARIECEANRLEELIARTLKLARLERPMQGLEQVPLDAADLLNLIVADVQIEADAHRCVVTLNCQRPLPVSGDRELLRSAMENVIRNAVRYSPAGSSVAIDAARVVAGDGSAGHIEVTVSDTGPGVPDKDLELIFEPFYRVDAARNRAVGGDGLGLAIAARAVGLHHGRIGARNLPSGGLAVHLVLPLDAGAAQAAQPALPDITAAQEKAALAGRLPTAL